MLGAAAGAVLTAVFLAVWIVARYGVPEVTDAASILAGPLAGALVWAGVVGAPGGALLLPLLALTLLRHVPLRRAVGYPLGGALVGVLAAAALVPAGPIWPVPLLLPLLALGGLLLGTLAARRASRPSPPNVALQLTRPSGILGQLPPASSSGAPELAPGQAEPRS